MPGWRMTEQTVEQRAAPIGIEQIKSYPESVLHVLKECVDRIESLKAEIERLHKEPTVDLLQSRLTEMIKSRDRWREMCRTFTSVINEERAFSQQTEKVQN